MLEILISVIISLISVFLYVALGTYVLTKNPNERTNIIFVLLMLVFIMWSVGTYNLGIVTEKASLEDIMLYTKLQLSGVIIAVTLFVLLVIYLPKKENLLKNPLTYISIISSIFLIKLILGIDISALENNIFVLMGDKKQDFFLYSAIFGITGVYLLLRHYMTSKYRQPEQAKIIMAGAILAIFVSIISNIILPMFFSIYLLPLSTLAPALMGVFFAYAVYHYGLHIKPVPEMSVTSFCGVDCTLCSEFLNRKCLGCRYDVNMYQNCEVYKCVIKKGYKDCGECPEVLICEKRKENSERCFISKPGVSDEEPKCELTPGKTHFLKDDGYNICLDGIKTTKYGLIVSTTNPQEIRQKYGLTTTPVVWISDEAFEDGINPKNLKRLAAVIINFMKKIENAVILLDGVDSLISINDFDSVQHIVQTLSIAAQTTNNTLIIISKMEDDELNRMKPLYFKRKSLKKEKQNKRTQ